jgi:trk system potassium uptake protein TrkH
MRIHIISRYIGIILLFNAAFLFIAFVISLLYSDSAVYPLLYSFLITVLFGLFPFIFVPKTDFISKEEGFVIVILSWLIICLIGILPYILWGGEFNFTNAWFESVSGYTTTGSSILTDIEVLPKGLLFWRSATHWIGGAGIILFALVVLPNLGRARFVLLKSELSPLAVTNFKYQTGKVLRILIYVYAGLTFTETILLRIAGMDLFDALLHSFGTVATGGFSTKNMSIAYFNSPAIEIIIMVFMLLSGMHFGLLFVTILGESYNIFKSSVVKYYIFSMLAGILLVSSHLYLNKFGTVAEILRYASFQVISLGTTTGYATIDTANWGSFGIMILMFFTFQCACAGSTSGGIKVDRVILFLKSVKTQVLKLHHPRGVFVIKLDDMAIEDNIINNALVFIVLYILIVFLSAITLTALGVDSISSISASAATMGNVGPGFGAVSSLGNYSTIPDIGKWVLTANMLLGRLEIYGFISLFMIKKWL